MVSVRSVNIHRRTQDVRKALCFSAHSTLLNDTQEKKELRAVFIMFLLNANLCRHKPDINPTVKLLVIENHNC